MTKKTIEESLHPAEAQPGVQEAYSVAREGESGDPPRIEIDQAPDEPETWEDAAEVENERTPPVTSSELLADLSEDTLEEVQLMREVETLVKGSANEADQELEQEEEEEEEEEDLSQESLLVRVRDLERERGQLKTEVLERGNDISAIEKEVELLKSGLKQREDAFVLAKQESEELYNKLELSTSATIAEVSVSPLWVMVHSTWDCDASVAIMFFTLAAEETTRSGEP